MTAGTLAAPAPLSEAVATAQAAWDLCSGALAGQAMVRLGRRRGTGAEARMEYRTRDQRRMPQLVPTTAPAAVLVYGSDGCCAALHLDLDVSRGGLDAVNADHTRLTGWLAMLGLRWLEDRSPTGGRHVYVPLATRMAFDEAKELVGALGLRFATLDPMPHASVRTGCITVPGTLHKAGGHRELITPQDRAYEALRTGNDVDAVQTLRGELDDEITAWRTAHAPAPRPEPEGEDVDDEQRAAAGSMSVAMLRLATGHTSWQETTYGSQSQARQAVITGAVRAGLRLPEIARQIEQGGWAGLRSMYARYRPGQRHRSLASDVRKAESFVATNPLPDQAQRLSSTTGQTSAHRSHTRVPTEVTRGGSHPAAAVDEHRFIRTWEAALRTTEHHRFPGPGGLVARFALRALGKAAHQKASRVIAYGARAIAVDTATEFSSAAAVLRRLAADPDGWIVRVETARGHRADTYELRIPTDLQDTAGRLRWAKGKTHALRPAFREIGRTEALVFEAIETARAEHTAQLPAVTGLSAEACRLAVATLEAFALVTVRSGALTAHPEMLMIVAGQVGALEGFQDQLTRYREQRRRWHAHLARFEPDRFADRVHDPLTEDWITPDDTPARPSEPRTPPPPPPVTVYVRPGCTDSQATCRALFLAGVDYAVRDITRDTLARAEFTAHAGAGTPLVTTTSGTTWTGHQVDQITDLIQRSTAHPLTAPLGAA